MSQYFSGILPPLLLVLVGGIAYTIFISIKCGFTNIRVKELVLVMFEFGTMFSATKIIFLALDLNLPLDNNFDRIYLIIAGVLTGVITLKDLISRFS